MDNTSNRKKAVVGILLIVVGSLFLLDNLGFNVDIPDYLLRWPMILVAIGAINLFSGNLRPAVIFLSLGAIFYLHDFDLIELRLYWPLILIILGISFIFRKKHRKHASNSDNTDTFFDELVIFGGSEKKYTSNNFRGGRLSAVFGGSEIDLRGAKPEDGAVIEIFCMFGGVEIFVPQNWKINLNATAVFGGVSDSRSNISSDPVATVHIKGFVMFGGGEIKN